MSPRKKTTEEETVEDNTDPTPDAEPTTDPTVDPDNETLTTEEADQTQDELKDAVEVLGDGFPPETPAVNKLPNRNLHDIPDDELSPEEIQRKYHPEWYTDTDAKSSDPTAAAGHGLKSPVETVTHNDKD